MLEENTQAHIECTRFNFLRDASGVTIKQLKPKLRPV
jgi:hypothetical protein